MKTPLLNETQASQYLNLSTPTLRKWRCTGVPVLKYYKLGRAVKYSVDDLEEFIRRGAQGGDDGDGENVVQGMKS